MRPISAQGRGVFDSLYVGGNVDTSADTAGGWWVSVPIIDGVGHGTWSATRVPPLDIESAAAYRPRPDPGRR